jgi:uncharacterized protein with PQ loop repeat
MSMPSDVANPAARNSSPNRLGRLLRDIGVNVFANLVAGAIIWLGVLASGYVRGNAKITAAAVAILLAAVGGVLALVVESVSTSLEQKGRMPKLAASLPGILIYVSAIVAGIVTLFDLTPNLNAAWRSIPFGWRLLLTFVVFIICICVGVIYGWRKSKRRAVSSPNDLPKAPLLLRWWTAGMFSFIVIWICIFLTRGIHLPWNY